MIKYEFWKNYLDELHKRRIPVYSVSSIFRRGQIFFKWYGGTYRNVLRNFDHLFVQNERSKRYLAKIGINRVTVVGDTRFDRVLQIREEAKDLPLVELFKNNTMTFVAGSSWQPDEDLFIEYFNHNTLEAAVYGIPVIFGPKYQKFQEAIRLLEAKGGFSIKSYEELKALLDRMLEDEEFLRESGMNAGLYVTDNAGATDRVLNMINF